jgi:hypothetical protein
VQQKTPAPPYDLALTVGGLLLQYPCRCADPPPRPRLGLGQVARHSISLNLAFSPSVYTNSPKSQSRPSHAGWMGTRAPPDRPAQPATFPLSLWIPKPIEVTASQHKTASTTQGRGGRFAITHAHAPAVPAPTGAASDGGMGAGCAGRRVGVASTNGRMYVSLGERVVVVLSRSRLLRGRNLLTPLP